MNIRKRIIEDLQLRGKRVIIRADYNVPLDDSLQITDDTRIRSTLPTINRAVDEGAKVILCSHLGRPKGKFDPKYSLAPVAKRLQRLLGKEVTFAPDCIGAAVESLVAKMQPGDVMLLENGQRTDNCTADLMPCKPTIQATGRYGRVELLGEVRTWSS